MTPRLSRRTLLRSSGLALGTGLVAHPTAARGNGNDPERVIIGTASPAAKRAARRAADVVRRELDFGPIGSCVVGEFPKAAREALRNRSDVRYVEPDLTLDLHEQEADWGVERIGATETASDVDGDDAHVVIIDSGIDPDHETLAENLGEGYAPEPCTDCNEDWADTDGHGTGVAGVVGATDNGVGTVGVAPGCTLHAARVFDGDSGASVSDVAAALEWTADRAHDVANISLGGEITSTTLENACQYAYDNGVLVVSSAGNAGEEDSVTVPAAYDTVVAVSAVDDDDDIAWFSSLGSEIDLTAPGVRITVPDTDDEYSVRRGTSFSAPHVAGSAALLMAKGMERSETTSRLFETAEDLRLDSTEQGHGLVRADRLVDDGEDEEGEDDDDSEDDEEEADDTTILDVETTAPIDIDDSSAILTGNLSELEGHDSATVYFNWGESGSELPNTTETQSIYSAGEFSHGLTDLNSDTQYEFEAVAAADDESESGGLRRFSTMEEEDESDDEDEAEPEIEQFELQERNAGPWTRVRIHWTVSHAHGALDEVKTVVDGMSSVTTSVSGDEYSDHHDHRERNGGGTYTVTLTVTDTEGNSISRNKELEL